MRDDDFALLCARILQHIARATSRRPMRAAALAERVGAAEADIRTALGHLADTRQIVTALIQRPAHDAAPWLAIWPTGVGPKLGKLTGNHFRHYFAREPSVAVRTVEVCAPRARPGIQGAVR